MTPRLLTKYRQVVIPALREKFNYKNVMAVPRIKQVVLNVGIGQVSANKDSKLIERIERDLTKLTGQKPAVRKAKKSIAGFKLREGMAVGMIVTLRGRRMYDFIDRFIAVALPRSRDFRGLAIRHFDERGNLNIGLKEHNIFPEVTYESLKDIFGLQITISTTAASREEGAALLKLLGFPIKQ